MAHGGMCILLVVWVMSASHLRLVTCTEAARSPDELPSSPPSIPLSSRATTLVHPPSLESRISSVVVDAVPKGALQLIDGGTGFQGILRIFHNAAWGTICATGWDFNATQVACRQLGYPGAALSSIPFDIAPPSGDVWHNNVKCRGDEETLDDCQSEGMVARTDCLQGAGLVKIQCQVSNYLGCIAVDDGSPALTGKSQPKDPDDLSVVLCIEKCRMGGFPYAAVQAPSSCDCGTHGEKPIQMEGEHLEKCNLSCPGGDMEICGGPSHASVYDVSQGSCGGKTMGKNISIVSPGFPGKYSAGFTCRWEATITENSFTTVRMPVLSLTGGDKVVITQSGETRTVVAEDTFEETVVEGVTKVTVLFTSEADSAGAGGFMLTFTDDSYCPPAEITNGSLLIDDVLYRPRDIVEVQCDPGFMPYRKFTTCSKSGDWYPAPRCIVYNKWNSWEFRRTILFISLIAVCVLFLMFMLTICYLLCGDTKKKHDGRYYGINTDSGERHTHDGETSPKEEYKAVGMEDAGDIDEEGREAVIPLASEVDV
nr:deleted in malignant brain tumors 1 protein-like [Lytechinus pictus]